MEYSISTTKIGDRSRTSVEYPALFRQPTDFQLEATTSASYPVLLSRFSSINYYSTPFTYDISASPYMGCRSNYVTQSNRLTYASPRDFPEVFSSTRSYMPISKINLDAALLYSMRFNPNSSSRLPLFSKFTYPSYPMIPNVVPKLP